MTYWTPRFSVQILIPILVWSDIGLWLVESDALISILVLWQRCVRVLLKPFNHEVPTLCIGPHPVLNERCAQSNLNDPVSDNLNPLVVGQVLSHNLLKEGFKPTFRHMAKERRVVDDR